jgi:L-fucose isomerase-like protein
VSTPTKLLRVAVFYSKLHEYSRIGAYLSAFEKVVKEAGLADYYLGAYSSSELVDLAAKNAVVFVASGGTSTAVFEASKSASRAYLVYHEEHNSLASATNAASMLGYYGVSARLLSLEEFERLAPRLSRAVKALEALGRSRILVVGGLPRWTARTGADEQVKKQLGVEVVVVSMSEAKRLLEKHANEAKKLAEELAAGASKVEVDAKGVEAASGFYYALRDLAEKYKTDALAVKCFDMLEDFGFTGCIGVAEFTARNGIAACEADIHAAVAMKALKHLAGSDPWVGNVSYVGSGKLELSHCVISRRLVKSYELTTHFESGLPVSIRGFVEEGSEATIVGYNSLKKLWRVIKARVARGSPTSRHKCRTQVLFEVPESASKAILEEPIEGHYVVVFRDVFEEARLFGELAGLRVDAHNSLV